MGDPIGKQLDSIHALLDDSVNLYSDTPMAYGSIIPEDKRKIKPNSAKHEAFKLKSDSIVQLIEQNRKVYKPKLSNYIIEHTFRAKNGFGGLGIHHAKFELDTNLTSVTYSDEIK